MNHQASNHWFSDYIANNKSSERSANNAENNNRSTDRTEHMHTKPMSAISFPRTEPNSSFIKVKDYNINSRTKPDLYYASDAYPTQNQLGADFNWERINVINQMMNRAWVIDPAYLEAAKAQCVNTIQENFKLLAYYQQYQNMLANNVIQNNQLPFSAFAGIGADAPKPISICCPKPLPVTRVDTSRMGRSHSMFASSTSNNTLPLREDLMNHQDKISEVASDESEKKQLSDSPGTRKRMNIHKCPHADRKHYAKNMCNNCYHKLGRNKLATKCPHKDRQNYAKGKWQNCYLNDYHKVKRRLKKEQRKISANNDDDFDRKISVETSSSAQALDSKLFIQNDYQIKS